MDFCKNEAKKCSLMSHLKIASRAKAKFEKIQCYASYAYLEITLHPISSGGLP
jgi:hypothetical protein